MTILTYGKQTFGDSNVDAFGRLRISDTADLFESKFTYGVEEKLYNTTTATGGTSTFLPNESAWSLDTTTSSGSRVLRESYGYMQYHPGKSQLVMMTGVFGAPVQNCVKRIGYYDNDDGLYFIQNGSNGFGVVERTSTSGTMAETITYQSNWNIDKLDGTGPSGITLDVTKTQIFVMDFQWLGVGTVRYGLGINGEVIYVHKSHHANASYTKVYMKTAWLPLRYEIVNVGVAPSVASLKQICSMVSSEGGAEPVGNVYSVSNLTAVSSTSSAWVPVLSITVNPTLNNVKYRGQIQLSGIDTFVTSALPAVIAIVENGTLTGPVWTTVNPASAVSYDTSSTAISGGTIRNTFFASSKSNSQTLPSFYVYGFAGDTFTVVARGIGGNASTVASINWREIL
jgi:hypothetical protein